MRHRGSGRWQPGAAVRWRRPQEAETGEIEEVIRGGSTPPWYYTLQHSDAKLSGADKDALIQGLDATTAASPPGG
jgi:Haem-binding domain